MARRVLFWLMLALFVSGIAGAGEFVVKEVVDCGRAYGPFSGALKWSLDGSRIAFFWDGELIVSDTMGNRESIVKLDMQPNRFEWLSDQEIIIAMGKNTAHELNRRINLIDISMREQVTISTLNMDIPLTRTNGHVDGHTEGPYLSIQGYPYYLKYLNGEKIPVIPDSKYKAKPDPQNLFFYRLHGNDRYLIRMDLEDSLISSDKSYIDTVTGRSKTIFIRNSIISDLKGSIICTLDTIPAIKSFINESYVCGILWESLNPKYNEVLFTLACDTSHDYGMGRAMYYNFESKHVTVIDTLLGLEDCRNTIYSPNGMNIAVLCDGRCFLIMRGVK